MNLGHPYQTRVSKVHRHIAIFLQQMPNSRGFGLKIEHDSNDLAFV